jgi:hypothetical protein
MMTARSEAATEDMQNFPHGKCGDSPQIAFGCGAALTPEEEDNGACSSYPDCVLP